MRSIPRPSTTLTDTRRFTVIRNPPDDRLSPGLTSSLPTPGPRYTGWTIEDVREIAAKMVRKHLVQTTLETQQSPPLDKAARDDLSTLSVKLIPDK